MQFDNCGTICADVRPLVREAHVAWGKIATAVTFSVEISCLRALVYTMDEDGLCSILFPPVEKMVSGEGSHDT